MNTTQKKDKKNLNWGELNFQYTPTEHRFVAYHDGERWDEGELTESKYITIEEGSTCLHYGQQCFEGMKAYSAKNGDVLIFRPDKNAARMARTAKRLLMPSVPEALFIKGVTEAVKANYSSIPPHGTGSTLYIRPLLIGIGDNLGLKTAPKFMFRVFVSPVGPYYKTGKLNTISLALTDYNRSAPQGIGDIKAGANYAGGLDSTIRAKALGADEAIYFDPLEGKYLDEIGSANIIAVMKGNVLATPKSDTILPSITRESLMIIAEKKLGMATEHRQIEFLKEFPDMLEMAACGTAAVLSPVAKILVNNKWYRFVSEEKGEPGPIITKLYDYLVGIQNGDLEDEFSWVYKVM